MFAARTSPCAALFFTLMAAGCGRSSAATPAGEDGANLQGRHTLAAGATRKAGDSSRARLRGLEDGVLRIWPMGDSITEGVEGGYRNDLYSLLRSDGIKVDYVGTKVDESTKVSDKQHEGHPAFTISNAQENIDTWLTKVPKPDVVLMMLGTNDFAWWTNVSVKEHHGYLVTLVDHVLGKLPDAVLVVATIPPQSSKLIEDVKLDRRVMTDEFNVIVRQWLPRHKEYGKRVFLADVAKELKVSDLYDGIHPSGPAHKRIARVWYRTLERALVQPR